MKELNHLKEITDELLGGLTPDQASFQRIMQGRAKRPIRFINWQKLAIMAAAFLLVFSSGLFYQAFVPKKTPQLETHIAGNPPPEAIQSAAIPRGSLSLSRTDSNKHHGIWATGKGGTPPLVGISGRFYRLLTNPTAVDANMLGSYLGSVSLHTQEPAMELDNTGIISNILPEGTEVCYIRNMEGAAIAASLDGNLRVFQRVAFSGRALVGGETLFDTLGKTSVVALQLSGIGTITDPAAIQTLMSILQQNAIFKGSGGGSTKQSLLIEYDNHIVLQMSVKDNRLSGCGTWHCAEFISSFASQVP